MNSDSLLVVDIGTVTTRAMLFDVVEGRYRFLAVGAARSTASAPFRDVNEGVRQAIEQLQGITGRILVGEDEQLISPERDDGSGVDRFAATMSAGPPLKVLAVGLLEDVSVESARRLASSTYAGVVESIHLSDRRKPEERLDAILRLRPDLVLMAGGTEGGAVQSVLRLFEPVRQAWALLPEAQRPEILFAGNGDLQEAITERMGDAARVHFAPNLRPSLEIDQFGPAQAQVAKLYSQVRARQIGGVRNLDAWSRGLVMPTASAFGRIIRFLNKAHVTAKGVLGVDVGASATTVAASFGDDLSLGVYPQFGLGSGLAGLLNEVSIKDITRWLAADLAEATVLDYLQNKALHPESLPVTPDELAIEQALTRQVLRSAVRAAARTFSTKSISQANGLLPFFEPILATGSALTRAPNLAHSLLMILDGLQPVGATTIILDQNHLASALGAAAEINPALTVQVLDSSTFLHLGTVISPLANGRLGTPVLRVQMTYESGHETTVDIKQGTLDVIPLPLGQTARLHLHPLHRADVGMGGPGRGGGLRVVGGALGVVIDARGRPLRMPEDPARRVELFRKWLWTLGG